MDLPFRMPLHAQGEALRSLDGKCLDQSVGSQRLDAQTGAETLDTLPMHRIDWICAGRPGRSSSPPGCTCSHG